MLIDLCLFILKIQTKLITGHFTMHTLIVGFTNELGWLLRLTNIKIYTDGNKKTIQYQQLLFFCVSYGWIKA